LEIIVHRINQINALRALPFKYGAEIDLRSHKNDIVVAHDAFSEGEKFADWCKEYCHGTLILNVKEEGLEEEALKILQNAKIGNFFFLDQSVPSQVAFRRRGRKFFSVRCSEFEPLEMVSLWSGYADWVWLDSFKTFELNQCQFAKLNQLGFSTCLVSPELQGRVEKSDLMQCFEIFSRWGLVPDAVCTKKPEEWETFASQKI
jgi:hypothetical protein